MNMMMMILENVLILEIIMEMILEMVIMILENIII